VGTAQKVGYCIYESNLNAGVKLRHGALLAAGQSRLWCGECSAADGPRKAPSQNMQKDAFIRRFAIVVSDSPTVSTLWRVATVTARAYAIHISHDSEVQR
jgi:hypothetical protein